jgi:erythromycin esterase-like protein
MPLRLRLALAALLCSAVACGHATDVVPAADPVAEAELAAGLRSAVQPLTGAASDYDPLLALVGDAHLVLLGDATHGTHEFYAERGRITERLIAERGFDGLLIEGHWPGAESVSRYVRGIGPETTGEGALSGFFEFPTWMWRNAEFLAFLETLRAENRGRPAAERAGVWGLDLYSWHASADAVIAWLEDRDPAAAARARERYACFAAFRGQPESYGPARAGGAAPCGPQAEEELAEMAARLAAAGAAADDGMFSAYQNALVVRDAEEYYSVASLSADTSWNLRDQHMARTVDAVQDHLRATRGREPRLAIWAHNSHVGDATATSVSTEGQLNIGQLLRERHGRDAVLVGTVTYTGEVMAAHNWGADGVEQRLLPAREGSVGALFHAVGVPAFYLRLRDAASLAAGLALPRLERAVGVVYLPETELPSHYFTARLADQFDAVLFFDVTRAVDPLDPS